jgi:hypothetical protein
MVRDRHHRARGRRPRPSGLWEHRRQAKPANDYARHPVDGLEDCGQSCPFRPLNLLYIPGLHGADCRRSRMVGLALLPEPRPKARNLPTRYGARDVGAQANRIRRAGPAPRCSSGRLSSARPVRMSHAPHAACAARTTGRLPRPRLHWNGRVARAIASREEAPERLPGASFRGYAPVNP